MVDRLIIDEWIAKAEENFEFARTAFAEGKKYYDQICFHFQQSAERYRKAYIIAHGLGFEWTHDLPSLLQRCLGKEPAFDSLKSSCDYPNAFYTRSRYPMDRPAETTKDKAQRALLAAELVRPC